MFERDKEELRELGIPLETGTDSAAHDDEPGYRIARRDYELPEVVLEPDEAAALGLAARLWQSAPLAGATGSALLKLQAAGHRRAAGSGALEPRVAASEPAFAAALRPSGTAGRCASPTAPPGEAAAAGAPGGAVGRGLLARPLVPRRPRHRPRRRPGFRLSPGRRRRGADGPAGGGHRARRASTCARSWPGWPASRCSRRPGVRVRAGSCVGAAPRGRDAWRPRAPTAGTSSSSATPTRSGSPTGYRLRRRRRRARAAGGPRRGRPPAARRCRAAVPA